MSKDLILACYMTELFSCRVYLGLCTCVFWDALGQLCPELLAMKHDVVEIMDAGASHLSIFPFPCSQTL